jgi:hypothetical protein
MGFRFVRYPKGYMLDDLCSSKGNGPCYSLVWQPWLKDLEARTAGEQLAALEADSGAGSPSNFAVSWDSQQRAVLSGFRPHESTSASAYFIIAPKTREMDIVWQRGDQITYLGPDSALLRNAHAYEWLKQVELSINQEEARKYELKHP